VKLFAGGDNLDSGLTGQFRDRLAGILGRNIEGSLCAQADETQPSANNAAPPFNTALIREIFMKPPPSLYPLCGLLEVDGRFTNSLWSGHKYLARDPIAPSLTSVRKLSDRRGNAQTLPIIGDKQARDGPIGDRRSI
jgi:hypothetical protein